MLKERSHIPEKMDDLSLNGHELEQTLKGLSFINCFLGNTAGTLNKVKKVLRNNSNRTFKIIDLGCGSGDNLRSIAKWCIKQKITVKLIGIDGNEHILKYATEKNDKKTNITYLKADILNASFELPSCDILISSHFMYHFTDEELVSFLEKAKSKVNKAIIFSDLYRSYIAYILFKAFGFLMPFHKTVKEDGLKAITRSFKKQELKQLLRKAGLTSYSIHYKWIFRYVLFIKL